MRNRSPRPPAKPPAAVCRLSRPAPPCSALPLLAVLVLSLGLGGPARAAICGLDSTPSATLLLPHFEVDLSDPNGLTTLFSINNAAAPAVLTRVTVWSDLAVPVLGFNIYLTGYDVQTINLRDIILFGNLPQSASAGQDLNDTISPKGIFSQDINYASCQGSLPPLPLPPPMIQHLQLALTGRASPVLSGLCAAQDLGDNIARGYITVDTVAACAALSPGDPGYFAAGGTGIATNQNQLWGTWFLVNSTQSYLIGSNMVGLEADATNPATSTPGRYTFYGRYVGWSAADNREPLASTFAAQYFGGGTLFSAGTAMIVWRDPKVAQAPFKCQAQSGTPAWYPMGQEGLVIFDEHENPAQVQTFPICPAPPEAGLIPFPAASQLLQVNSAFLPVPFPFGWLMIDLNTSNTLAPTVPPFDTAAAQAYVISAHVSNGHAAAIDAFRLDSSCTPNHFTP